jgi:hypothetical protein
MEKILYIIIVDIIAGKDKLLPWLLLGGRQRP